MELLLVRVEVITFLHLIMSVTYTGSFLQLTRTTCLEYQECVQDSDCPEPLICGCSAKCGKICKARGEDDTELLEAKRRAYKLFGITVSCDSFPNCTQDTDCSQDQKCGCHDLCGSKCLTKREAPSEHAGQCPGVPTLFPCYSTCEYDYHCQMNEKCCPTLCSGKTCRAAILQTPPTTMVPPNSSASSTVPSTTPVLDHISNSSQTNDTTSHPEPSHNLHLHSHLNLPIPVCGSNGLTFNSIHHLRMVNLSSSEPIHIAYTGPCRRNEECRGPACSKGPQIQWTLVDGRIHGYLRDHDDVDSREDKATSALSIPLDTNNTDIHP